MKQGFYVYGFRTADERRLKIGQTEMERLWKRKRQIETAAGVSGLTVALLIACPTRAKAIEDEKSLQSRFASQRCESGEWFDVAPGDPLDRFLGEMWTWVTLPNLRRAQQGQLFAIEDYDGSRARTAMAVQIEQARQAALNAFLSQLKRITPEHDGWRRFVGGPLLLTNRERHLNEIAAFRALIERQQDRHDYWYALKALAEAERFVAGLAIDDLSPRSPIPTGLVLHHREDPDGTTTTWIQEEH